MGASLPAELNGAPGPLHVLQLAVQLKVTPEQQAALERLTIAMKTSAQQLGAQVIAAEAELDEAFKSGAMDDKTIQAATARITVLQGQLSAVHLTAHLLTKGLLSQDQVVAYNVARGLRNPLCSRSTSLDELEWQTTIFLMAVSLPFVLLVLMNQ